MTLEERMTIIEQKAVKDKIKEMEKKNDLQIKTQEELIKITELTSRIEALITIANKCIEQGITFPSSAETSIYGYGKGYNSYDFFADGIYHHVGFMNCKRGWWKPGESPYNKVQYLGINEGGYCGVWDFYTNGKETFLKHEDNGKIKDAELSYLQAFLKEFDVFEEAFYKWIDSLSDLNN